MSVKSTIRRIRKRAGRAISGDSYRSPESVEKAAGRKLSPGQLTRPTTTIMGRYFSEHTNIIPRPNTIILSPEIDSLRRYSPSLLLKQLQNISPDASMAIWTIIRLCGSDISWRVYDAEGMQSIKGQKYIDEIMENLQTETGGMRNILPQLFKSIYIQGACCAEVVLEENLRDVKKLIPVDPSTITFFKELRGEGEMEEIVFVPKQMQNGQYVSLDKAGFYYIPLDPDIGDPYGTSPILSIITTIFYYLRVIFDLNQVVHNQAWERLHITVLEEVLRRNVNEKLLRDDKKMANFLDQQLAKVTQLYSDLEPDDTFVTTDSVSIDTVGGKNLGGNASVRILLDVFDRLLSNSLKTMSSFLNQHKGKTETYSSVEWMIQVAGIESIREIVKSMLDNALSFILQVKGIQGRVEIEFPEIPLDGVVTIERVKWYKSRRVLMERDAGIISHDTAANLLYEIPQAEGPEIPVDYGTISPGKIETDSRDLDELITDLAGGKERFLTETHPNNFSGLNTARVRDLLKAFEADLTADYNKMAEEIINKIPDIVQFKV